MPQRISWPKVVALSALILQSDGFLAAAFDLDEVFWGQIFSGFFLVMSVGYLIRLLLFPVRNRTIVPFLPVALLSLFVFISIISNTTIFPKPTGQWILSLYIYLPILSFYFLALLNYKEIEVIYSIFLSAIFATLLTYLDSFVYFEFLDFYSRRSIFGIEERRVVIIKYEVVFLTIYAYQKLLANNKPAHLIGYIVVFFILVVMQAGILQSRLSLLNIALSCAIITTWMKPHNSPGRLIVVIFILSSVAIVSPFIFDRYLEMLNQQDLLSNSQYNVSVRIDTFSYYYEAFLKTSGIGFGMMSSTGDVNNPIALGLEYGLNFVDLGVAAALLQFGVVGILAVLATTLYIASISYRAYKLLPARHRWRPAVLAAFIVGSVIAPVPANFFSLGFSTHFGGLLLFLAWRYRLALLARQSRVKPGRRQIHLRRARFHGTAQ